MPNQNYPFVSESAKVIYELTELDGKQRIEKLGCDSDIFYSSVDVATNWKNAILTKIDKSDDRAAEAIDNLEQIYSVMIDSNF